MADEFKIVASLNIPESTSRINKDIPKLEGQAKHLKIVADLNPTLSIKNIQATLNKMNNNANIKIGIDTSGLNSVQGATQNITNGLKSVQIQAQQTAKSIHDISTQTQNFKFPVVEMQDKEGNTITDTVKTLQNARDMFSKLGFTNVKFTWVDEAGGIFDRLTAKVTDSYGAVQNFKFSLLQGSNNYTYDGASGTDSGVEKLITSMQKAQDKVKALRTNLTADLKSIRSAWEDVNGGKSVKSDENIERLKQQYIKTTQAIRELRKADDTTLASMKANADAQINKLSQMVTQYHNAEKVATQLRAKGFETVKIDTGNNIDKFINSINNSKVPIQAMQTEINKLTSDFAQLDTIQDQAGKSASLTNILNTLDNAKTKFQSLKELFKGFGNADWLSVNSEQINKINDMATKIAIYKNNLIATRDEWKSQGIYVGEIQAKVTSLARSLPNIKKPEKFNEWVQEWNDINQKANQLKTNLDSQVATHNKIYEIQSQIAKLNPTKDGAEIARLNEKLSAEQKTLSNLQMQSNVYSNLVSLEQQEQYITEQTVKSRDKLLSSTNTGIKQYQASISSAISELQGVINSSTFTKNSSNSQVTQTKQEISSLITAYQNLMNKLQGNITPVGLESVRTELTQLNARFNSAYTSAKKFETELKNDNGAEKLAQKVDLLTSRIKAYQTANSKANKTYGSQFTEMLNQLNNPNIDNETYNRVAKHFQIIRQEINATGKAGKTFFRTLGDQAKKFASWMTLTGVISTLWREMRKMVTNVIELDDSLLELSKVSELSSIGLQKVTKDAYALGKEVGKTGTQVIDAITNFKRAGFDLQQSTSFAKDALVLTNVAEGINDASEAATALISIMKGYGDTTPEFAQKILDSINQVSNTQAINFDDLVDGSQRLSAVAKQAGASFEQMLGILTGTNEVLQNIEKTSSGEITIFTRLQGIQLPDEEDVMPIAKLQETISKATKGAANIVDQTTGELRNVYDILDDINKVWETLDKNTQEGIAFAAAGTRQKNVFLSMMENWDNVKKSTQSAMDSTGSAIEENQKYLDSISGKLANLESNFQSLSQTIINSDLIKFIVDSGAKILDTLDNIINNIGTIPTLLSGIATIGVFKNVGVFKQIGDDTDKFTKKIGLFSKSFSDIKKDLSNGLGIRRGLFSFVSENDIKSLNDFNKAINNGTKYSEAFNAYMSKSPIAVKRQANELIKLHTQQKILNQQYQKGKITQEEYKAALSASQTQVKALTTQTQSLTFAQKAIGIMLVIDAIVIGITKLVNAKKEAAQAAEEAREKAVESAEVYKDEADSLKELQSRYTELIASTNDISTVKDELASIQDELINKYGDEAEAIDVVNGKYAETIALIKEKQLEEAKDYTRTNKANYDKAKAETEKTGYTDWIATSEIGIGKNWEEEARKAWETAGININYGKMYDWDTGEFAGYDFSKFSIGGTLQEQYDTINQMAEIYGSLENYDQDRYNLLVDEAFAIKEQLDAYNQIIKQYEEAQKVINNLELPQDTKKEFNELLNKAVEAYNTLNTSNSPAARGEAYEELKSLETALKNLAGNNTDLQQIVTDTFNSFKLGVDNTNTSLTTLSKTFSDYLDNDFKSATDNISKLQDAIMNIAKGEYIDNADFWELFNLDENGLLGIPTVIDGKFKVSIEKLIALKDELINKQKEQIALDQEEARLAINNAYKNLSIEERKLNDLRSKVNSPGDIRALKAQEQVVQDIKDSISGYREIISKDNWLIQVLNSNLGYTKEIVDSLTESLQEQVDNLQEQADNLLKAQENQIDKIVDKLNDEKSVIEDSKKELEEQLKVLEEQKDEIEEIISNYEKVSDIVSETIQSEIDSLEENRQSVEDYYDEMINKLQEANDERQESINLAEKLAALENAKNNKVRVFDETRGWTYEADKSAIESAQEDLLNAQNEAEISRLEKEKKAALADYDAQIKPLQEYEKQWSDSLKGITDAENEALAEQILGADWREKIKARDTEILTQFQNNYGTYKTRLHNLVSGEIADLNNSIKAKDNEIEAKERQIESWQKYKTEIQNAAEEINGAFKDYTDNLNQLTLDENSSYEDRLKNFDDFIYSYAEKVREINNLKESISGLEDDSAIQQLNDQLSFMNEYKDGILEILDRLQKSPTGFGIVNSAWDAKLIQGSYDKGGVIDYTGLAQMHGTKSSSEIAFNARDGKKLYDLVHGSDSLVDMFRDKLNKTVYQHNANATNNKTTNIYATFGDIVSNNPETFAKFMKDYLERVKSESGIF